MHIGCDNNEAASFFTGNIDAFRFLQGATATSTETPSASAPAIADYKINFFSIPEMKMYEVTGASAAAGSAPQLTQKNRVFIGECDTGAAAVSAVRNYAIRGQYDSALGAITAATITSYSHNIGAPYTVEGFIESVIADVGYTAGIRLPTFGDGNNGTGSLWGGSFCYQLNKNVAQFSNSTAIAVPNGGGTGGTTSNITIANWRQGIRARRSF